MTMIRGPNDSVQPSGSSLNGQQSASSVTAGDGGGDERQPWYRPFSAKLRNKSQGGGPAGAADDAEASEQTKKKVQAAKSYIENMYKVQHQNIQGRLER